MSTIAGWATPCRAPSTTPAGSASWAGPPSWRRSARPWTATRPPGCCSSTAPAASASPRCSTRCAGGRWPAAAPSSASTAATWPGRSPRWRRPSRRWPTIPARCCSSTPTSCSPRSTAGSAASCCRRCPPGAVAVLAGREPPDAAWSADAGWRRLLRACELAPLDAAESATWWAASAPPSRPARGWRSWAAATRSRSCCSPRRRRRAARRASLDRPARPRGRALPRARPRRARRRAPHRPRHLRPRVTAPPRTCSPRRWASAPPRCGRGSRPGPSSRHSGTGLHLHDLMRDLRRHRVRPAQPAGLRGAAPHDPATTRPAGCCPGAPPTPFRDATELFLLPRHPPLAAAFRQLRDEGVLPVEPGRAADHAEVAELVAQDRGAREGDARGAVARRAARMPLRGALRRRDRGVGPAAARPRPGRAPPTRWWRRRWRRSNGTARCGPASGQDRPVRRRPARAPQRRDHGARRLGDVDHRVAHEAGRLADGHRPRRALLAAVHGVPRADAPGPRPGTSPSTAGTAGGCPLAGLHAAHGAAASSPARPGRRRRRC